MWDESNDRGRHGIPYLPGAVGPSVHDEVLVIDGLECDKFILLKLVVFNLGVDLRARGGLQAREA